MLPPMKYKDKFENIQFKSFNTKYLKWLFGHFGFSILYTIFLNENFNSMAEMLAIHYNFNDKKELSHLKYYIKNFSIIFSNNIKPKEAGEFEEETEQKTHDSHSCYKNIKKMK